MWFVDRSKAIVSIIDKSVCECCDCRLLLSDMAEKDCGLENWEKELLHLDKLLSERESGEGQVPFATRSSEECMDCCMLWIDELLFIEGTLVFSCLVVPLRD